MRINARFENGRKEMDYDGTGLFVRLSMLEYFQKYLKQLKPQASFVTQDKIAYAHVSTTEFRPYIEKVLASGADGVLVSLYGGNLNDFIRQGWGLGLFDKNIKFLMNLSYSYDVLCGLGMDMPSNVWLGGLYWFENNNGSINKKFVEEYKARYRIWPDYNSSGAYSGVLAYAAAAAKAGSTEAGAIIKALEGLTLDLPAGRSRFALKTIKPSCPRCGEKPESMKEVCGREPFSL